MKEKMKIKVKVKYKLKILNTKERLQLVEKLLDVNNLANEHLNKAIELPPFLHTVDRYEFYDAVFIALAVNMSIERMEKLLPILHHEVAKKERKDNAATRL